jgi:hypothetical protein
MSLKDERGLERTSDETKRKLRTLSLLHLSAIRFNAVRRTRTTRSGRGVRTRSRQAGLELLWRQLELSTSPRPSRYPRPPFSLRTLARSNFPLYTAIHSPHLQIQQGLTDALKLRVVGEKLAMDKVRV